MQQIEVNDVLARAKLALNLKTDLDLAEFLDVPRSTIASWKNRKSIPVRYLAEFASVNISIDWLLSGKGPDEKTGAFGFSNDVKEEIDTEVLWISLILVVNALAQREKHDESQKNIMSNISKEDLFDFSTYLYREYQTVVKSKRSWQQSNIVKEGKMYEALIQEYGLAFNNFANPPWWDDSDLV